MTPKWAISRQRMGGRCFSGNQPKSIHWQAKNPYQEIPGRPVEKKNHCKRSIGDSQTNAGTIESACGLKDPGIHCDGKSVGLGTTYTGLMEAFCHAHPACRHLPSSSSCSSLGFSSTFGLFTFIILVWFLEQRPFGQVRNLCSFLLCTFSCR